MRVFVILTVLHRQSPQEKFKMRKSKCGKKVKVTVPLHAIKTQVEWRYSSNHSQTRHFMEMIDQPHILLATLRPDKEPLALVENEAGTVSEPVRTFWG
jgi:hypothetical protein